MKYRVWLYSNTHSPSQRLPAALIICLKAWNVQATFFISITSVFDRCMLPGTVRACACVRELASPLEVKPLDNSQTVTDQRIKSSVDVDVGRVRMHVDTSVYCSSVLRLFCFCPSICIRGGGGTLFVFIRRLGPSTYRSPLKYQDFQAPPKNIWNFNHPFWTLTLRKDTKIHRNGL